MFFLAKNNQVFLVKLSGNIPTFSLVFESQEGNIKKLYSFCRLQRHTEYCSFISVDENKKSYFSSVNRNGGLISYAREFLRDKEPITYWFDHRKKIIYTYYNDHVEMFDVNDNFKSTIFFFSNNISVASFLLVMDNVGVYDFYIKSYYPHNDQRPIGTQIIHKKWTLRENNELYIGSNLIAKCVSKAMSSSGSHAKVYYLVNGTLHNEEGKSISTNVNNFHLDGIVYLLKDGELFYINNEETSTHLKGNIILPIICDLDLK